MSLEEQYEIQYAQLKFGNQKPVFFPSPLRFQERKGYTGTHLSVALAKKIIAYLGLGVGLWVVASSKNLVLCMFYKTNIRAKRRPGKT
jgi:hypothetical protein